MNVGVERGQLVKDCQKRETQNVNNLSCKGQRKENYYFMTIFYVLGVFTYVI